MTAIVVLFRGVFRQASMAFRAAFSLSAIHVGETVSQYGHYLHGIIVREITCEDAKIKVLAASLFFSAKEMKRIEIYRCVRHIDWKNGFCPVIGGALT